MAAVFTVNIILMVLLGIVTSYTDIKYNKIYNKHLVAFFVLQLCIYLGIQIFSPSLFASNYLIDLMKNFIVSIIIAYILYLAKIWPAGDGKLFCIYVFLMPLHFYSINMGIFAGISIFLNIFAVAIGYIIIDTLLRIIFSKQKDKLQKSFVAPTFNFTNILIPFLFLMMYSILYKYLFANLFPEFYIQNLALISLIFIITVVLIARYPKNIKVYSTLCVFLFLILLILTNYWRALSFSGSINYTLFVLIVAFVLFNQSSKSFNFIQVPVAKIKPGMVLSPFSYAMLHAKKVIDMVSATRALNEQQVDQIKYRMENEFIYVYRKIPFAPIIFTGVVLQLIFKKCFFI